MSPPTRAVHRDRAVEFLRFAPERVVSGIAQQAIAVRIGPHQHRAHALLHDHPAHLGDGGVDLEQRDGRDTVQARGISTAEVRHPVVVGAAGGGCQVGLADCDVGKRERGKKKGHVDSLRVHVLDARVRVVAAGP